MTNGTCEISLCDIIQNERSRADVITLYFNSAINNGDWDKFVFKLYINDI